MKKIILGIAILLCFTGIAWADSDDFRLTFELTIKGQRFNLTVDEIKKLKSVLDCICEKKAGYFWDSDCITLESNYMGEPAPNVIYSK